MEWNPLRQLSSPKSCGRLAAWLFFMELLAVPNALASDAPGLTPPPVDRVSRINELTRSGDEKSHAECLDIAVRAVREADDHGSHNDRALAKNEYGLCLQMSSTTREADIQFIEAAAEAKQAKNEYIFAIANSNLARNQVNEGKYLEAIKILTGLVLPQLRADRAFSQEANSLITLATAYILSADFDDGLKTLTEAESVSQQAKSPYALAGVKANRGFAYLRLGRLAEAAHMFSQASELAAANGFARDEAYARNGLCQAQLLGGSASDAVVCYERALKSAADVPEPMIQGALLQNYSVALTQSGKCPDAISVSIDVIAISRSDRLKELEGRAFGGMMRCLESTVSKESAIVAGYEAISIFGDIRRDLGEKSSKAAKTFIRSRGDTFRDQVKLLVDTSNLPEAEAIIGELKDDEYFEFTRGSPMRGGVLSPGHTALDTATEKVANAVNALAKERTELLAKQLAAPLSGSQQDRLATIDRLLSDVRQSYLSEIERIGRSKDPRVEQRAIDLRYLDSIRPTLQDLGTGTVLLSFVIEENQTVGILTAPNAQTHRIIPVGREQLGRMVFEFRQQIADPRNVPLRDTQAKGLELYNSLFAPFEVELRASQAKTIMLSLDGVLRYVPFAAIFDGKTYLVDRYALAIYTPAAVANLKDVPNDHWKIAGLGITKPTAGFRPLVFVKEELSSIVTMPTGPPALFPGEVCVDECFTGATIQRVVQQKFSVIHIASHFVFRPGDEGASFLLLGDGSQLTLRQIRDSDLAFRGVDLLTLSACETGMGGTSKVGNGVEIEGFGVLAQNQGAKGVIATLWPTFDRSTSQLMATFYGAQIPAHRVNKAEALRLAQVNLRSQPRKNGGPNFALPYYWAPFILLGNWK
jgi:CHAT domain-containing protein